MTPQKRLALLLGFLLAGALAGPASAAAKKGAHPDLSGFWQINTRIPRDKAMMALLPPGAAVIEDTGAPELPRGDFGGLKLKPAAAAAAAAWDPRDDLTVSKACSPPSIVYAMQGPFPLEIYQGTELIVIKLEYYDLIRVVFMDGRGHPPASAPHTKAGHSIGRWEGDTLVVDTTHLQAATITNNGLSHSENVHFVERFRLGADGKTLLSTELFEDPEVLDNQGARFVAWTREPGQYVNPYDCDPSFGLNYTGGPDASPTPPQ